MKSEAIMKSYVCNGEIYDSEDMTVFNSISKPPIYEVVRVINGKPLFLDDHLERMFKSGSLIGYDIGFSIDQIKNHAKICIKENCIASNNIKLLAVENDNNNKLFLVLAVESFYPPESYYKEGIKAVIFEYERDNPHAKVQHGDYKQRVKEAMDSTGSFEALLKNRDGYILEGSRSNMFYIIDGTIMTAPSKDVLLGITRKHIIKLCEDIGYKVVEEKLHISQLDSIEGMFISGTSIGVLPISNIGSHELESTQSIIITKLLKAYDELTNKTLG